MASSIISSWSESQGRDSIRRSKEREREREGQSKSPKKDSRRLSSGSGFEVLELGLRMRRDSVGDEQQGRLAMEGQWTRKVSISGIRERERERNRRGDVTCGGRLEGGGGGISSFERERGGRSFL